MKLPIFLILLFTGSFVFAQEQTQDNITATDVRFEVQ